MLKITREILDSNKEELTGRIITGPSLAQQDLHLLSQLRGQILALEQVLQTKDYLMELVEETDKLGVNNEVNSSGSEIISKS